MDLLIPTVPKRPQPILDADDAGALIAANFAREQEEAGIGLLSAVQSVPWAARPFLDDEATARGPNNVCDDEAFVATQFSPTWTAVVFGDEDPVSHLAAQDEMQDPSPASQQAQSSPWMVPLAFLDDETIAHPALGIDDEITLIPMGGLLSAPYANPPVGPLVDDGDVLPTFRLEQEDFFTVAVQTVWLPPITAPPLAFADEDAGAPLGNVKVDQEEFFVGAVQSVPWTAFVVLDAADQGSMRVSGLDQEEFFDGRLAVQSTAYTVYSPPDDADSIQLGYFALAHDEAAVLQTQSVAWTATPFLDDETSTSLISLGLDQQESYVAQTQAIVWLPVPFRDDETTAGALNFALEQEEPYTAALQSLPWLAVSPAYDETSAGLVSFALEDERAYDGAAQQTVWVSRPALDDELYARFGLEDEQPYTPQIQSVPWTPAPFRDDETAAYIAYDDEPPYVAAAQSVLWNCIACLDDEIMVVTTAIAPSRRLRIIGWDSTTFTITGDGT